MASVVIDRLFAELFTCGRLARNVTVIWHSGEPLTLPPAYYDDAIGRILQLQSAAGAETADLRFDIQTNGVRIDDAWCAFFLRHAAHLDLGISCDGPATMHDAFRVSWNGRASHAQTMRGMELLERHGIRYRIIAVVTERTLADPDGFFRFFHERRAHISGFRFNLLADGTATDDPLLRFGVEDRQRYYAFYRRLLELCREAEWSDGSLAIRNFTQALARVLAARGDRQISYTEEASAPVRSLNVDADGNITTFYAGLAPDLHRDQYGDGRGLCLGNILETPLDAMLRTPKLAAILADFAESRRACQATCPYFAVCPGGYELTKLAVHGRFDATETPECVIHVQALTDALLDDVAAHIAEREAVAAG